MKIMLLTAQDIEAALPMTAAIEVMRSAFGQLAAGDITMPLRSHLPTAGGVTLVMPAYLHRSQDLGIKIVSVNQTNAPRGLPVVSAVVLVVDPETGIPVALLEGTCLTALRTGAVGGLAADILARPDATQVTLFGAGVQGRSQLEAVCCVRSITRANIVDPTEAAARRLSEEVATWPNPPKTRIITDPQQAIHSADIVIAATTSKTPLFDGRELQTGTHVTGIGSFTPEMQEIDATTVNRARVVVDQRDACLAEAGDLIKSGAGIDAEIGEIINGRQAGRSSAEEITFFKSVGVAVQDAAAAGAVLAAARKMNLGIEIALS